MRKITDHKLSGLNDALEITVLDEPGQGGACHEYEIKAMGPLSRNPSASGLNVSPTRILFQNGPIQKAGVNGISGEALAAVMIDRLRSFQEGEFKCRENAIALTHFEEGLMWLQSRTRRRLVAGTEGTNVK